MSVCRILRAFASLALLCSPAAAQQSGIPARITQAIDETNLTVLQGNTHPLARPEFDRGQAPSDLKLDRMPAIPVKIAMNVGNPQLAFDFCQLPNEGVGLARLEFIISNTIGIHPKACLEFATLPAELKAQVARQSRGYANPVRFYVDKIAEGVATIAAAFWPKKVIVRLSDFKSNEYRNLIGGTRYEPHEENPMLGFRGASRYIAPEFYDCFELECRALKRVRDGMGLTNVEVMIPFVRTLAEA